MKRIAIVLLLIATPAMAESSLVDKIIAADNICGIREENARKIMEYRQDGVSMSRLMRAFIDLPAMKDITQRAYDLPRFRDESNRQAAIDDFGNAAAAECYANGEGR